ncbi:MAG: diphthine synthase [Candidatus Bathyarchaeota archaeon]|nr:diphthine synthase [Candidatus Bathyarchaeota archaeon]
MVFVGLGLHDEKGISLRGLEEIKTAEAAFMELYTSLLPNFSKKRLEKISGKKLQVVSRKELEEENGKVIIEVAEKGKAVLLVPGDPLIATTHVALRIHAEKLGIETRIVHGASILSAVIGLCGLHNYKFGKSVTIPFPEETPTETPYEVIAQNKKLGLHTLCLLDIKAEEKRYLSIAESLGWLLKIEKKRKEKIITSNTLMVGVARAGSKKPTVKAGFLRELMNHDFGEPPHSIVFPGKLHFMEAEALVILAGASDKVREMVE